MQYRKSEFWVDGERDVEQEQEQEEELENNTKEENVAQPHVERKTRTERNKEMRKKELNPDSQRRVGKTTKRVR